MALARSDRPLDPFQVQDEALYFYGRESAGGSADPGVYTHFEMGGDLFELQGPCTVPKADLKYLEEPGAYRLAHNAYYFLKSTKKYIYSGLCVTYRYRKTKISAFAQPPIQASYDFAPETALIGKRIAASYGVKTSNIPIEITTTLTSIDVFFKESATTSSAPSTNLSELKIDDGHVASEVLFSSPSVSSTTTGS